MHPKLAELYVQREKIEMKIEVMRELLGEETEEGMYLEEKEESRAQGTKKLPEYSTPPSYEDRMKATGAKVSKSPNGEIVIEEWVTGGDRPDVSFEQMGKGNNL